MYDTVPIRRYISNVLIDLSFCIKETESQCTPISWQSSVCIPSKLTIMKSTHCRWFSTWTFTTLMSRKFLPIYLRAQHRQTMKVRNIKQVDESLHAICHMTTIHMPLPFPITMDCIHKARVLYHTCSTFLVCLVYCVTVYCWLLSTSAHQM